MALVVRVAKESEEPVYEQIARQIRAGVGSGDLGPGTSLPTVRGLAGDLGINLNTVARAYRVLEEEGFVTIENRRGVRVAPPARSADEDTTKRLHSEFRGMLHRLRQAGLPPEQIRQLALEEIERLGGAPASGE